MHLAHIAFTDTEQGVSTAEAFFLGVALGAAADLADLSVTLDGSDDEQGAFVTAAADDPVLDVAMARTILETCLASLPDGRAGVDGRADHPPTPAVRRAKAFVHEHAREPISVGDIAAAARLSVRGLQQAFHTSVGVSPTVYLRQVRLETAHVALLAGNLADEGRVSSIARAAGFAHLSRFAAAYRARYGENPHDTLRR